MKINLLGTFNLQLVMLIAKNRDVSKYPHSDFIYACSIDPK